jgi:Esterase/lipase
MALPAIAATGAARGGGAETDVQAAEAGATIAPDRTLVYKTANGVELRLHVFNPAGHDVSHPRPCIVLFHGGAFTRGDPSQFYPQAKHLAERGMVAVSAQYRLNKERAQIDACIADAKSAIRWVRGHAAELGIDPAMIAAGGGSAGGHLATATAILEGFDDPSDDLTVSCIPNALILFNAVIDMSPDGYGYDRAVALMGDEWARISPAQHLEKGLPPTLFLVGSEDRLIKPKVAKRIEAAAKAAGSRFELKVYEGAKHGFFNFGRNDEKDYYALTVAAMDEFLASLGYLEASATVTRQ